MAIYRKLRNVEIDDGNDVLEMYQCITCKCEFVMCAQPSYCPSCGIELTYLQYKNPRWNSISYKRRFPSLYLSTNEAFMGGHVLSGEETLGYRCKNNMIYLKRWAECIRKLDKAYLSINRWDGSKKIVEFKRGNL